MVFSDDARKQTSIINGIMNTITDIFTQARAAGSQPISFEIFPPKGELSMESARTMADELAKLDPSFISVTYSAGGSGNRQRPRLRR